MLLRVLDVNGAHHLRPEGLALQLEEIEKMTNPHCRNSIFIESLLNTSVHTLQVPSHQLPPYAKHDLLSLCNSAC